MNRGQVVPGKLTYHTAISLKSSLAIISLHKFVQKSQILFKQGVAKRKIFEKIYLHNLLLKNFILAIVIRLNLDLFKFFIALSDV